MGDMKLCRPYFWLVGSAIEIGSLPNPKLCRSYFYLKIFVWKMRQRIEKIKKSKIKKSRIRQNYSANTPVLPLLPVLPHVDLCEKKALIII